MTASILHSAPPSVRCLALVALLGTVSAEEAGAQDAARAATPPASSAAVAAPNGGNCGSPRYRKRVAAFLTVAMIRPVEQPTPSSVANLLQVIADRADTILHVVPGVLPQAEPAFTDADLDHPVFVTWYRDGKLAWRIEDDTVRGKWNPHAAGARLIAQSLAAARTADEIFMIWPDSDSRDSIQFRVGFVRPTVDGQGNVEPIHERLAIPIFSVNAQMESAVAVLRPPRVVYPKWSQEDRVNGRVIARFVVDTNGRADVSTLTDIWPEDKPRLTGELGVYYRELLEAVRDALPAARYQSAMIGGCKVRQAVVQPFTFQMR